MPCDRVTRHGNARFDDELVLRNFSKDDDNGEYENMVKLPTPTLCKGWHEETAVRTNQD